MNTVAAISSPSNYRSQAFRYVLLGGFIAGLDDTIYPTVKTLMAGKPWFSPWKGVASGLIGKAAGEGGMEVVARGLALHYFICISAACGAAVGRICAAATTARPEATANGTIDRFISFPPWFTSHFTHHKLEGRAYPSQALRYGGLFLFDGLDADDAEIGILAFPSCNHLTICPSFTVTLQPLGPKRLVGTSR